MDSPPPRLGYGARVLRLDVDITLGKINMAYKFMGEDMPELTCIPTGQRRASYLRAVKKSYGHFGTWAGLCLFVALAYCGAEYSHQINESVRHFFASKERSEMFLSMGMCCAGIGTLYYFQMKAIKAEVLKIIESQQTACADPAKPGSAQP